MAEILIVPGSHASYEDGDVLCAMNDCRIGACHAERICQHWNVPVLGSGWRDHGHDARFAWYEKVYQYRFERISATEVRRVNIATGDAETLGPEPNAQGEAIDVQTFLRNRSRARTANGGPKAPVFGEAGSEVWYGGHLNVTPANIDSVWAEIEGRFGNLRSNHSRWPFTNKELAHFLALPVDDFDNDTRGDLEAPLIDENDVTLKKRKHRVSAWRDLFPMDIPPITNASDVADRNKVVDVRERQAGGFARASIVSVKV